MKFNYKPDKPLIRGNDLKKIAAEYELIFNNWLNASDLSVSSFLSFGGLTPFEIHKSETNGVVQISLTCGGAPVGLPFISPAYDHDSFIIDTAYMLLYIANKLDGVSGGSYFYDTARAFNVANIGNG